MLLFEALGQIEERLKMSDEYKANVPEYFEALEIAKKSIEKHRKADGTLRCVK